MSAIINGTEKASQTLPGMSATDGYPFIWRTANTTQMASSVPEKDAKNNRLNVSLNISDRFMATV